MQSFAPRGNIIMQDNCLAMLLETKGISSAGKRMRHMDVRYFLFMTWCKKAWCLWNIAELLTWLVMSTSNPCKENYFENSGRPF